jgi:hypothetical protein
VKARADAAYRWSVISRCIAAAAGGYVLVTLLHLATTAVLPAAEHKTLLFTSQTGYLYWTGIIIWSFAARTARRAWLGLILVAIPLASIDAWFLVSRGLL